MPHDRGSSLLVAIDNLLYLTEKGHCVIDWWAVVYSRTAIVIQPLITQSIQNNFKLETCLLFYKVPIFSRCLKLHGNESNAHNLLNAGELPFWLSLCCRCLDIVNVLLSAKCMKGCYFLPILNQPQGVAKQWVQGEGRNGGEKIENIVHLWLYQCHNFKYEIVKSRSFIMLTNSSPNSH